MHLVSDGFINFRGLPLKMEMTLFCLKHISSVLFLFTLRPMPAVTIEKYSLCSCVYLIWFMGFQAANSYIEMVCSVICCVIFTKSCLNFLNEAWWFLSFRVSDYCLHCYIHDVSADMSSSLFKVFLVELGSLYGTSNHFNLRVSLFWLTGYTCYWRCAWCNGHRRRK